LVKPEQRQETKPSGALNYGTDVARVFFLETTMLKNTAAAMGESHYFNFNAEPEVDVKNFSR